MANREVSLALKPWVRGTHGGVAVDDDVLVDGSRFAADRINVVSHAHFDHIPKKYAGEEVTSSPLTAALVAHRRHFSLDVSSARHITLLDSGHIPGAMMAFLENGHRTLVTGDFSTRPSFFSRGAAPVSCDVLVVETTFGFPDYVFPDPKETWKRARDWIEDQLSADRKVILMGYPLGKAQQICHFLDRHAYDYAVAEKVWRTNQILAVHGHSFTGVRESDAPDADLLVMSVVRANSPQLRGKEDYARAVFSGWATHAGYKYQMGVDAAFPFSDHCDFPDLIRFIDACGPEQVYTHHGFDEFMAAEIGHQLGIDACPLPKEGPLTRFC